MLNIIIPGFKTLALEHLVLDFNGVLAVDGKLVLGTDEALKELGRNLQIHVITADTQGTAKAALEKSTAKLTVLPADNQDEAKRAYVAALGGERCVCIGNGRNDRLMLREAALGIAVLHLEGLATEAALASHLLVGSAADAFDLLLAPKRLIATLRS
jgi:P-type E1-E2 ATPase